MIEGETLNKKFSVLIKDVLIFGLGRVGSRIILFFLVPLYTHYLTTEEYGLADLVYTTAELIRPILSLVIYAGVIRFGLMKESNSAEVLKAGMFVGIVGSFITIAITPLFNFYSPISPWKWCLSAYIILTIHSYTLSNYLKVKGKNRQFAIISIIETFCLALFNILLLAVFHIGIKGYFAASVLAVIISIVLSASSGNVIKDLHKARFNRQLVREMVIYSSPLILNNVSWWLIHCSDKYMIEALISASALGIYTVATKIPSLINVLIYAFGQAWNISSIKEMESSNDSVFYSKVFEGYTLITFGVCISLITIIKPFMDIYVGKDFQDAWMFVPLLLVSAVFSSVASYYAELYSALKKSVNSMITTLIAAIINVLVNYFFIMMYGIWGAVIGTVACYIVLGLIRMVDVHRFIKIKIDYARFFTNIGIIMTQGILVSLNYYTVAVSSISIVLFILVNSKQLSGVRYAIMKHIS